VDGFFQGSSFLFAVVRDNGVNALLSGDKLLQTLLADGEPASAGASQVNHDGTQKVGNSQNKEKVINESCKQVPVRILWQQPVRKEYKKCIHDTRKKRRRANRSMKKSRVRRRERVERKEDER